MKTGSFVIIKYFLILLLIAPVGVGANQMQIIGDPIDGDSWTQTFSWFAAPDLVRMEAFIVFNDTGDNVDFDPTGLSNFQEDFTPAAGWSYSLINPDYSLANGPNLGFGYFTWDVSFTGFSTDEQYFSIDFLPYFDDYAGGEYIVFAQRFTRVGTDWQSLLGEFIDPNEIDYNRSSIPEPSTILLLGVALIGFAGLRRKFKS